MNNRSTAYRTDLTDKRRELINLGHLNRSLDTTGRNEAINKLYNEGGDSFYDYVDWIGLIKDPDLVVLSSLHHFYFDNDDMKDVSTVINLKQLNLIKDLNAFLNSIFSIIPQKSNFVGCFQDHNSQYKGTYNTTETTNMVDSFENGITSRVPFINSLYNFVDSKTNRVMNRDNVNILLRNQGFKVLDMTNINSLTFFHSQKPPVLNVLN